MPSKKSVCEIFQSMDISNSDKATDNVEIKEWLENYRETEIHTESSTNENISFNSSSWKLKLKSVVSYLEVNWKFLTQVLNETLYNLADSKEIVTSLCKDLNFYFNSIEDDFFYIGGNELVDVNISEGDLYILGRLLAPLLTAGYTISIHPTDTSVIPYLAAIGHLITKAEVPKGTKYLLKPSTQIINDPTRFVISAEITSHFCPMVIFEDADLYSALDCLIDSCQRFNGKLYWSVTHAYIQESMFDNFVSKLKDVSQRMPQIILIDSNQRDKLKVDMANGISKFFVGWDPRDLELNSNLIMAVSLLPFRTTDEAITLVNSQNVACTASLWTEKISVANYASRLLKTGTTWINSHGNVDPMIPLESFSESHLPLNGVQLIEYIYCLSKFKCLKNNSSISLTSVKMNIHFSNSVEEAVNFGLKGYEIVKKFDDKTVQKLLSSIVKAGLAENDIPLGSSSTDTLYHPSTKMDVLCFSCSYKVVMLIFPSETLPSATFLKILYHLMETRNTVIVCGPAALLSYITMILPSDLPPEIITLLDLKNYNKCNEHAKRIGKTLIFNLNNVEMSKDLNQSNCLKSVFKGKKSIWMSTY